jgi:shikimate kinase
MTERGPVDRHLVLIGMMGAGKTTVGAHCATLLGRRFVDIDDLVEHEADATVAQIFAVEGEPAFRVLERHALGAACASAEPLVISCGGGAVLDAANCARLRETGLVFWLRAHPEVLAERLGRHKATRPLLASTDALATLAAISAERDPVYESTAHVIIDTAPHDIDGVSAAVLEEFARCTG